MMYKNKSHHSNREGLDGELFHRSTFVSPVFYFLVLPIGTIHPGYSSAEKRNFKIQEGPRQAGNTIPGGHQSMPAFLPGNPALRDLNLRQKPRGRIR